MKAKSHYTYIRTATAKGSMASRWLSISETEILVLATMTFVFLVLLFHLGNTQPRPTSQLTGPLGVSQGIDNTSTRPPEMGY